MKIKIFLFVLGLLLIKASPSFAASFQSGCTPDMAVEASRIVALADEKVAAGTASKLDSDLAEMNLLEVNVCAKVQTKEQACFRLPKLDVVIMQEVESQYRAGMLPLTTLIDTFKKVQEVEFICKPAGLD